MKALIIYDDFATVVRANVALQYSGRNADFPVQWNVNLWQIDMLKFSPTAEEALTDALAAHLIVIANSCAKSSTIWFQSWVEHWAKCRYINGAGLALLGGGGSDGLATSAIGEFSSLARRHGLSLILDDGRNEKDQSNFIEHSLDGHKPLPSAMLQPILGAQFHNSHSCWGINE